MTNFLQLAAIGIASVLLLADAGLVEAAPRHGTPIAASALTVLSSTSIAEYSPRDAGKPIRVAEGGNCSRAAAQAQAQTGGEVLSVASRQQGGRTVCVITLLVPSSDGGRPRKTTITIPQ
ncbi:hypothetical protein [Consotaella salsifontis]|uniref:Uncharacterized protein n=1 Tax=Consotaella salsifontis TaxID=1365950 RepID=A0A1T4MCJ6_9HYPH|nr:hypothetical protein [Consotaella salsifontis]SJZ64759.1 hypothetical protein SAMN05428963_10273 [Consotaella salsifontis]